MSGLRTLLAAGIFGGLAYGAIKLLRGSSAVAAGPKLQFQPTPGATKVNTGSLPAGLSLSGIIATSPDGKQVVFSWVLDNQTDGVIKAPAATYALRRDEYPAIGDAVVYQPIPPGQKLTVTQAYPVPMDKPTVRLRADVSITSGGGLSGDIEIGNLGKVVDLTLVAKAWMNVAAGGEVPDFMTGQGVTVYDK